jgi:hypothetical protein
MVVSEGSTAFTIPTGLRRKSHRVLRGDDVGDSAIQYLDTRFIVDKVLLLAGRVTPSDGICEVARHLRPDDLPSVPGELLDGAYGVVSQVVDPRSTRSCPDKAGRGGEIELSSLEVQSVTSGTRGRVVGVGNVPSRWVPGMDFLDTR